MAQRKESWSEKRAKKEVGEVKSILLEVIDRRDTQERNFLKMKDRENELENELVARADAGENRMVLARLLENLDSVKQECALTEDIVAIIADAQKALTMLYSEVNAMMSLGWYRYIVRVIPERKIHKILSSEDQQLMEVIIDIVEKSRAKITDKLVRSARTRQEGEARVKRMQAVAQTQREMQGSAMGVQDVETRIAAIRREKAAEQNSATSAAKTDTYTAPMPNAAPETESVNASNLNKA